MAHNRLFLIDGSALAYRSHFAFAANPLRTKRGENTSVVFGFAATILRLLTKEGPTHLAVVTDTKEKTFRNELYADYKANRVQMPPEMAEQLPRLDHMLDVMKIPVLRQPGYEADDIIATLTRRAERDGWEVIIVTGDKDLMQLVTDKVKIFNLKKLSEAGEWYDREAVKEKMGVYPEQILDFLSLTGDTSDNVPGVDGVGPKTAVKLLEEYGTFEDVLASAEKITKPKLRDSLIAFRPQAPLTKQLVSLDYDAKFDYDFEAMRVPSLDNPELRSLFLEFEFTSLIRQLGTPSAAAATTEDTTAPPVEQKYETLDSEGALKEFIKRIKKAGQFAFDTETTGLDWLACKLVGISLSASEGDAGYIPLAHQQGKNLDADRCRELLQPLFLDKSVRKIAQNFKFDYHVLHQHGYEIPHFDFDPMIASYVADPAGQHGLDALAIKHFDYRMQPISDLIGTGKKQITFDLVPIDKATFYSSEDADFTLRLVKKLQPMVEEIGAQKLLHEIELPLCQVLAHVEENGVRIDVPFLKRLSGEMAQGLEKITFDIFTLAGREFNINSTAQLSDILFNQLKLKPMRKTAKKTGYSTDVGVLTELAKVHDLPRLILEFRKLQKLKSTYIDALPDLVSPRTGRVHTSYNQTVATTGRLSSTDPNLQNIPIKTEEGSQIRRAFIPADAKHKILTADYSQIELRVLAHCAKEGALVESFNNGEDIHARTASEVYSVSLKDVTPQMRRMAKTANFAVIYGVTAFGLSQQSDMTVPEAKEFIDIYFARYPMIRKFIDDTIAHARKEGYVTTLFGRRRYLPEINSKNVSLRQFAERTAVNTIIQGTAADMIKIAMIEIDRALAGKKSMMIMQVHDELVFDVHEDEVDSMSALVRDKMENCVKLDVPITVEMGVGDNWLESK